MSKFLGSMINLDIIQGPIRFREHDHAYIYEPTGKKLTSVSDVISTVYAKKTWDGVDPSIVENARLRGSAVDKIMSTYIREGLVTVDPSTEVGERVVIAHRIWEEEFHGMPTETQKIVYSLEDGIAGTVDFWIDDRIVVDLKCTYSPEKSWILQLGAYSSYLPTLAERGGIIHISPKTYPNGGIWMEYDIVACRRYWRKAVDWWKETHGMAKAAKI